MSTPSCILILSKTFGYSYVVLHYALYCIAGDVTLHSMQLTVDSDLTGESPQFTFTFISNGGPATNVTWTRNSNEVLGGVTVLNNTVTAQYTHTLTVTGRLPGQYQCIVSNEKPSTATANFTVQGEIRIQHSVYVPLTWESYDRYTFATSLLLGNGDTNYTYKQECINSTYRR